MSTKPTRQLDWINDDSSSKYTIPDSAAQLAGHLNDTNADNKIFNWCWWRVSQWLEYLDELILDQIPEGTTYGKVKLDDLTSGRVDIDKLDQSGKTHGLIYQAGISSGKVNLTGALGITGVLPIGNHDSRVSAGLDSNGDYIRPVRTDKVIGTSTYNSNVVFNQNGLIATNGSGVDFFSTLKAGQVVIGKAGATRIDYSEGAGTLDIVGGVLSTSCQVPASTIQAGTMTGVTVQSASSGARAVLSNQLSVYKDRGDTVIAEMYRQFNSNYVVDLGAGLTNPAQITWSGIRVNAGDTAGWFTNWDTTGLSMYIGGKANQILRLESLTGNSDYGLDFVGSFDNGFMRVVPETGTAPTHSANKGTFWLDTNADFYVNSDGSTTWDKFLKTADVGDAILGDGTSGRHIRVFQVEIEDGTNANTIKVQARSINNFNGDDVTQVDNLGKGGTVGDFTLSALGNLLTIKNSGLTGDFLGGMGALISTSVTTKLHMVHVLKSVNGMDLYVQASDAVLVDLTADVDTGKSINFQIIYFTTA